MEVHEFQATFCWEKVGAASLQTGLDSEKGEKRNDASPVRKGRDLVLAVKLFKEATGN